MSADDPAVLVINAGSSSLKYQLLNPRSGTVLAKGLIERIGTPQANIAHTAGDAEAQWEATIPDAAAAFRTMMDAFGRYGPDLAEVGPVAVGHRVVHGGAEFTGATVVDDHVHQRIAELTPLAPLHNPANLAGIDAAATVLPDLPQIAVFDTAFHATIPPAAYTYAIPREWEERYGIRRYGFHGTSHRYVSQRTAALLGRSGAAIVVLHLGNGCSACAVRDGRSIDTSMGLTPLEGLVMGTRSGDLDPSVHGHLARVAGLTAEEVDAALNNSSGLRGLAGDNDFRTVMDHRAAGDPAAELAFEVVVGRLVKYVGAYAAELGRLDALTFTGGIGENSPALRAAVLDRLSVFGFRLDPIANDLRRGERLITATDSRVRAYVVPTNEERQIGFDVLELLG